MHAFNVQAASQAQPRHTARSAQAHLRRGVPPVADVAPCRPRDVRHTVGVRSVGYWREVVRSVGYARLGVCTLEVYEISR
jgi:hypothetical protein